MPHDHAAARLARRSFELRLTHHRRVLIALARTVLGPTAGHLADEVAQRAFAVVFAKPLPDDDAALGARLRGVAVNIARRARRDEVTRRQTVRFTHEVPDPDAADTRAVDPVAELRCLAAHPRLRAALDALPELSRRVLVAVVIEGECGVALAAELGVTPRALRYRVTSSLATLRAALDASA